MGGFIGDGYWRTKRLRPRGWPAGHPNGQNGGRSHVGDLIAPRRLRFFLPRVRNKPKILADRKIPTNLNQTDQNSVGNKLAATVAVGKLLCRPCSP